MRSCAPPIPVPFNNAQRTQMQSVHDYTRSANEREEEQEEESRSRRREGHTDKSLVQKGKCGQKGHADDDENCQFRVESHHKEQFAENIQNLFSFVRRQIVSLQRALALPQKLEFLLQIGFVFNLFPLLLIAVFDVFPETDQCRVQRVFVELDLVDIEIVFPFRRFVQ